MIHQFELACMKKLKLIALVSLLGVLSSCISFTSKTEVKLSRQSINGIEYTFANHATFRKVSIFFTKGFQLKNKIRFFGMGRVIEKEITQSDFERKIKFKRRAFHIDNVSFSVNDQRDRIDLIYYLTQEDMRDTVTFVLVKEKDDWVLSHRL